MPLNNALSKLRPRHVVFGFILLVAAIRRFSLPAVPFADGDFFGYLLPAVRLIEDHTISHEGTRSFVYPLFIAGLLKIWGSVTIIPIVQHVVGLLTGCLIFSVFEQPIFTRLKTGKLAKLIVGVQLFCSGYYLLSSSIFQYEHFITSQAICTLLLTLQLLLLVKMLGKTLSEKTTLKYGSLIVFLALLTFIFTPKMGFALPLIGLLVLAEFYFNQIPFKKWILPVLIPTAIFITLLWLPENYLARRYDPYTFDFPFKQFFYSHADKAKTLIQKDIKDNHTPYATEVLKQIDSIMVLPNAPHQNFKFLGFDVDTMLIGGYDVQVNHVLAKNAYNTIEFQKYYDQRIITELPGPYALKIADQIQHFYTGADGYTRVLVGEYIELYNVKDMTLEMTQKPELNQWQITQQYQLMVLQQIQNWEWSSNFSLLTIPALILKHLYVYILMLSGVLLLIVWLKLRPLPVEYKAMHRFALYLLLLQFALVLTVAVIHTFDYHRYAAWFFPTEIFLLGTAIISISLSISFLRSKQA